MAEGAPQMQTDKKEKMKSEVTFVMPAYNAAPFLERAVGSVADQSVAQWRLVIVDDASTDATLALARQFAATDSRIRVVSSGRPSGSAFQPRRRAILEAATEYVAPLDADDWIEARYLEKMLARLEATGADIVYPTMINPVSNAPITPSDSSLLERVASGRSWVGYTLDGWRINCNGGLIRRMLYLDAFRRFGAEHTLTFADEMLGRQLLLLARTVALSDARYYYFDNPGSVTHRTSIKQFHYLYNNIALLPFTAANYGSSSEEYILAQRQNFHGVVEACRLLRRTRLAAEESRQARQLIAEAYSAIDFATLRGHVSPHYWRALRFPILPLQLRVSLLDRAASLRPGRK